MQTINKYTIFNAQKSIWSQRLLSNIEKLAINIGCCKITLKVLEGNTIAKNAYFKYGFNHYQLSDVAGNVLF